MDRLSTLGFSTLLLGIGVALKYTAWRHKAFADRLKEQNLVGQIRVKAGNGRYYVFKDGKVSSHGGIHPNPDVVVTVKSARLGIMAPIIPMMIPSPKSIIPSRSTSVRIRLSDAPRTARTPISRVRCVTLPAITL